MTDVGSQLAGFVISFNDFDVMLKSAHTYIKANCNLEVDLFYSIISTIEVKERGKVIIGEFQERKGGKDIGFLLRTILSMKNIFERTKDQISSQLRKKLLSDIENYATQYRNERYGVIVHSEEFMVQRILAAILLWNSENCSPYKLYDDFKIYYEQMRRLLEIISYRIDIILRSLPIIPNGKNNKTLKQEIGRERINNAALWLEKILDKISYQPSNELCSLLEIQYCDLYKAQNLRSVENIFRTLLGHEKSNTSLKGLRKNIFKEMQKWPKSWQKIISKRFWNILHAKY